MSSKLRILAMTATRSDYDLLSYVYNLLATDESIDFRILVSGTHLSKTYGYSAREIENDGFKILSRIETLLDSDTRLARVKSASLLLQNSLHTIADFNPNIIIYCGDREDALIGATIAAYLQIPGVHFFGGDHASDGNIDNPVRHAISKLSTAHFVSISEHKQRLLKLGEPANRIFQVGTPAIDKLIAEKDIPIIEMKKYFQINGEWPARYAVLTHHSMPQEEKLAKEYMQNIIECLLEDKYAVFCNFPNVDAGSKSILESIRSFCNHEGFYSFQNLPRNIFVNLMRKADLMIGNSSAGIIEAATCKLKVINVGMRQQGRFNGGNVQFCSGDKPSIKEALQRTKDPAYLDFIQKLDNPYGDGKSSEKIYNLLKTIDFKKMLLKTEDPLCI